MFVCQLCNNYGSFNYSSVLSHIGSVHSHQYKFSVCCGVDGCTRTYTNYHAFRRHVLNRHGNLLNGSCTPITIQPTDPADQEPDLDNMDGACDDRPPPQTAQSERMSSAMFILNLKEKHKLAQTTVDDILGDTEELVGRAIERLKKRVASSLTEAGVNPEEVPNLLSAFDDSDITQTFSGLKTEHLQTKFYRENMGLVVSFIVVTVHRMVHT